MSCEDSTGAFLGAQRQEDAGPQHPGAQALLCGSHPSTSLNAPLGPGSCSPPGPKSRKCHCPTRDTPQPGCQLAENWGPRVQDCRHRTGEGAAPWGSGRAGAVAVGRGGFSTVLPGLTEQGLVKPPKAAGPSPPTPLKLLLEWQQRLTQQGLAISSLHQAVHTGPAHLDCVPAV